MKKQGDAEKSITGTLLLTFASFFDYFINIVTTYFLARLLTPSDYGEVTAITVLIGFADIIWQIGLSQSLIQKKDISKKDINTAFFINSLIIAIIICLLWWLTPFWQKAFNIENAWMLRIYSLVFVFNGLMAIPIALLHKKMLFKKVTVANIISHLVYAVAVIVLALSGLGPWALVIGVLIRYFTKTIVVLFQEKIKYDVRLVNKTSALTLLNFSGGFTVCKIFNYIATTGDHFVINKTLGKVDLGFYQKAYSLLMYPTNLIGTNLESVSFSLFSKNQDKKDKVGKAFIATNVFIIIFAAPISLICFYIGEPLINVFLGSQWTSAVIPFKIMIIGLFFRTAYKLSVQLIKSQGKVYKYATIEAIYAFLILLFAYIGHFYGVNGVAMGTTIAFIANFFMLLFVARHYVGFSILIFFRDIAIPILVLIPYGIVLQSASNIIDIRFSDLQRCMIYVFLVLPTYIPLILKIRHKVFSNETSGLLDVIIDVVVNKLFKKKKSYGKD